MKINVQRVLPLAVLALLLFWFAAQRPSFSIVTNETAATTHVAPVKLNTPHRTPGIDLSHFQGTINWNEIAQDNVKFVFAKASQGVTERDPKYTENAKGARDAGIPFGAYHFFSPSEDGKKQAEHFLKTANLQPGDLPPVLDVETLAKKENNTVLITHVDAWLRTVRERLGCKPILYASRSFQAAHLSGVTVPYHYWLASYSKEPRLPKDVSSWLFWQHSQSGKVKGISGAVDLNWFAGKPSDLEAFPCK